MKPTLLERLHYWWVMRKMDKVFKNSPPDHSPDKCRSVEQLEIDEKLSKLFRELKG